MYPSGAGPQLCLFTGRGRVGSSISCVSSLVHPFFKQRTAYEILRSDWSSDVCSSD
eukprot:COSAG04_NODE_30919_length_260_cov_0.577640_1_plen_55_part_10